MSHFETIDSSLLVTATGGAGATPRQSDDDGPQQRTWGQVARDYTAACVQGAGQSVLFEGRPRNWREGLSTAAFGCATGMGMRAIDDLSRSISGSGGDD